MKVNGKDDIPYMMENKTCSKPPTSLDSEELLPTPQTPSGTLDKSLGIATHFPSFPHAGYHVAAVGPFLN